MPHATKDCSFNVAGRTGGAADYSKWKFDIASKYTTIKPGGQ
jgi:hypothetical protein